MIDLIGTKWIIIKIGLVKSNLFLDIEFKIL